MFFVINMREVRVTLIAICWLMTVASYLVASYIINGTVCKILPFVFLYALTSYAIMIDAYKQYLLFFLISRKLRTTLETNIRLADQNKAAEMRHMIANVAHDLKTVSFYFPLSAAHFSYHSLLSVLLSSFTM